MNCIPIGYKHGPIAPLGAAHFEAKIFVGDSCIQLLIDREQPLQPNSQSSLRNHHDRSTQADAVAAAQGAARQEPESTERTPLCGHHVLSTG